ncbi:MAG: hypothetical protein C5B50_17305 [Verrucomicrobia bacterium]|nr:MAG: hypothetical protein C5B50_17305 [Verrucomicrobiota bacterium]
MMQVAMLLAALVANPVARAEPLQSANPLPLLDHLIGRWVLSGTIAGKKTTHKVSAEWILNHGYVQLHELSREKVAGGRPAYEALIFISFDSGADEFSCLWLDSTTNSAFTPEGVGHAKVTKEAPNAIPFVFKDSAGHVTFENTFVYDQKSNSWEWIMANVTDDKKKPFGHVRLVKK